MWCAPCPTPRRRSARRHHDALYAASGDARAAAPGVRRARCRPSARWPGSRTKALMDAVTAVSGSGPALCVSCSQKALTRRRRSRPAFRPELADRRWRARPPAWARATCSEQLPGHARDFCGSNVTSPGGTTAAALDVLLAKDGLGNLLLRAVAGSGGALKRPGQIAVKRGLRGLRLDSAAGRMKPSRLNVRGRVRDHGPRRNPPQLRQGIPATGSVRRKPADMTERVCSMPPSTRLRRSAGVVLRLDARRGARQDRAWRGACDRADKNMPALAFPRPRRSPDAGAGEDARSSRQNP